MDTQSTFDAFNEKKQILKRIFASAIGALKSLGLESEKKTCANDSDSMERETFKVLVVGEFKRGKSTFINALLGDKILPSYASPCTAIINEVKYGEEKRALLYFRKNDGVDISSAPSDIKEYLRAHGSAEHIDPLEIPVERIEEFVVIERGKDQEESVSRSPYEKLDLFWPLQMCRNNVEIIDSPGLNEHGLRTKVTTEYVPYVDAVIFVTACDMLAGASEIEAIQRYIVSCGHEDIFFVCNRFDQIDESERPDIVYRAKECFGHLTRLGDSALHFLSSKQALNAKIAARAEGKSKADLSGTGFEELERSLVDFLVHNRGRIKLMRPANALKICLQDILHKTIPLQIGMLGVSAKELARKYELEKPRLDAAEKHRLLVREKLAVSAEKIKDYVRREVRKFLMDYARNVPEILKNHQAQSRITFFSRDSTKKQCETLCKELTQYIESELGVQQQKWGREVLVPALSKKMEAMFDDVKVDLDEFMESVASIRANLSNIDASSGQNDASGAERAIAAGVGALVLSYGSVIQAGQEGFKGLLKSIIPQLGVAIGLCLVGVFNPLVIIGALFATGGIQAFFQNANIGAMVKKRVGEEVKQRLTDGAEESADQVSEKVQTVIADATQQVGKKMEAEISSIKECVKSILEKKKECETADNRRIEEINTQKVILERCISQLDALTAEL